MDRIIACEFVQEFTNLPVEVFVTVDAGISYPASFGNRYYDINEIPFSADVFVGMTIQEAIEFCNTCPPHGGLNTHV